MFGTLSKPINPVEIIDILQKIKNAKAKTAQHPAPEFSLSEDDLIKALDNDHLELHYQPQICLDDGSLHGVEALVRWRCPERGLIFPDKFIELAETSGLIEPLSYRVIKLAIEQEKRWSANGLSIPISVNVSAKNILSLKLPEKLFELVAENAIVPEMISLELTETAVMEKLTSSLDVLNRLRMKGFSLSIDDFGTGYSSLIQLYQVPFTELKIDRSFVGKMLENEQANVIAKICIMLGKMLNMRVVAEGVESKEIYDELCGMQCDIAQGYYIARPMMISVLEEWLNAKQVF